MSKCLLCGKSNIKPLLQDDSYFYCKNCISVSKNPKYFISSKAEKERYLAHENDVTDLGYQNFVSPVVSAITADFDTKTTGLDFGAGTGPVIAKLLTNKGYRINLYDPFFHPNESVLNDQYDFIVCCEVIEHFHQPLKEFTQLKKLLKPNGKLYCMTDPWSRKLNFENWYYKNDPTHVIFYSVESLKWIQKQLGFTGLKIEDRLFIFTK